MQIIKEMTLFQAGEGGYPIYRIPALCVTARGSVLVAGEARTADSDWGAIDILLRRSTDGGETFDAPRLVSEFAGTVERDERMLLHAHAAVPGRTHSNPVFVAERSGAVHLLYCVEYRRVVHRISNDDGLTWGEPRDITDAFLPLREQYPWRVVAVGPGHGIALSSGRTLVPFWMSRGSDGPGGDHRPSVVGSVYSDDGGATWRCGEIVARENEPGLNPSETTVAELADGRIVFNIRSESPEHRRLVAYSPDGATGWTRPAFHPDLPEPVCHAALLRVGDALIFGNPDPPEGKEIWGGPNQERRNYVLRVSRDDGATFAEPFVLYPGPAGYSDLAALPDGTLLCFYERDENALTLARIRR